MPPFRTQVPRKSITIVYICAPYMYPGVEPAITVFGEGGAGVRGDKRQIARGVSAYAWQLNSGCIADSNLIGLHLLPTATGRPSAKRDTRRGSRAAGTSILNG